nr:MAG TPA: PR domain zinc finger protein-binding domain, TRANSCRIPTION [Caudoviricetes sp.]
MPKTAVSEDFSYIFYRKKQRILRDFYLFCEKCNNKCVIFL